ncbi:aspartate/glutamate racemase family protein [Undibacterium sp. LX40W]|uniref:Aspartate/glutamate racemase family protein n=1 Tax=Undibacterium nitidum TaxID=2762298 RepID=A0A923HNL9_9BURK|nr:MULTISPECIES: aspartate/glutamate racemase family protein [Undibacterium]MBC3882880.1 aspartate/glutamate racemase family protein [Undibacterium nitidum]MBC3893161.1 aspartate/glutamate racemase family protein [Undibacterium sp. LX40W]
MKTIGMIGGMSWESTIPYYRIINQTIKQQLGGLHSAKIVLVSVDFHEIEVLQRAGDWETSGRILAQAAHSLELAGADFVVLCTNTMHKVAGAIESAVKIPLFHIADPTAEEIKQHGFTRIGLLGTRFTMEQDFYRQRLQQQHGLEVVVPTSDDMDIIHRIIYQELCLGKIEDTSRDEYRRIMANLVEQGAQAIILGCTEISLLVGANDASVPLFDTTGLHAAKAAEFALGLSA